MTLSEYIKSFPRNERTAIQFIIACVLDISEVYVRLMCCGRKSIPGKFAIRIEYFTGGAVSRHTTAPHLYPLE